MYLIMTAENAHIQQAIAEISIFANVQPDGVAGGIAHKDEAPVVKNFFSVYNYLNTGEIVFPERPPDGPEVGQVADVSGSGTADPVDDCPIEPKPCDRCKTLIIDYSQIQRLNTLAFKCAD